MSVGVVADGLVRIAASNRDLDDEPARRRLLFEVGEDEIVSLDASSCSN